MEQAASEQADRALRQYVNGGRTLADIGVEFAYLRQERGLSQHTLAQRVTLPLETVQAVESGRRLPTEQEFVRRCCVAPTQGRLKANLGWDQIAKTSSSNAAATRRLVGSLTPARSVRAEGSARGRVRR
jgi:DNA-binding XRE family transcriptional regulator